MDAKKVMKILEDTAYVHTGGSAEELRCAQYLRDLCTELGMEAHLEEFEVDMADIETATLEVSSAEIQNIPIPCKGYLCA